MQSTMLRIVTLSLLALFVGGCVSVSEKRFTNPDDSITQVTMFNAWNPVAQDAVSLQSATYPKVGEEVVPDKKEGGKNTMQAIYGAPRRVILSTRSSDGIVKMHLGTAIVAGTNVLNTDRMARAIEHGDDAMVKAAPLYKPDNYNVDNSNNGVQATGTGLGGDVKQTTSTSTNVSANTNVSAKLSSQTEGAKIGDMSIAGSNASSGSNSSSNPLTISSAAANPQSIAGASSTANPSSNSTSGADVKTGAVNNASKATSATAPISIKGGDSNSNSASKADGSGTANLTGGNTTANAATAPVTVKGGDSNSTVGNTSAVGGSGTGGNAVSDSKSDAASDSKADADAAANNNPPATTQPSGS